MYYTGDRATTCFAISVDSDVKQMTITTESGPDSPGPWTFTEADTPSASVCDFGVGSYTLSGTVNYHSHSNVHDITEIITVESAPPPPSPPPPSPPPPSPP